MPLRALLRPIALIVLLIVAWHFAILRHPRSLLPSPWSVLQGIADLMQHGLLFKYVVASLFRVTWGFLLALLLAVPLGIVAGWHARFDMALNPLLQILRPISPLAWIPIAILWFGVGDLSAIFLIFLGCFFPLLLTTMNAVKSVARVHVDAARNFGLSRRLIYTRVLLPAILPQLLIGMRITLGIAWLVVVAAEMIAGQFRPGLSDCGRTECGKSL